MGLPPLEYIECYLDSPGFREIIALYEKELEENAVHVKSLVKECRHMIQATEEFSKAQQSFATALSHFRFQTIGEETEAEKMIMNSLQTFAQLLFTIEDYRHSMLSTISVRLLQNLERFRKEHIQKTKEEKKQFDRSSEKYYQSLEKKLGQSSKKKETVLAEFDNHLEIEHAGFRQASFNYVCKLQEVHAMKQYELIEPIIGYISDVSTFLHQAYDSVISLKPELHAVQFKVQILRETQLEEQEKQYELKAQVIEEGESGLVHHPEFLKQGLLYVQDVGKKVGLGPTWRRYFCQFHKEENGPRGKTRQLKCTPVGHHGSLPSSDYMDVKNCIRSRTDEVDRRFCFEVELYTSPHKSETRKYVCQALSQEDRKGWMEILEGKEPVYTSLKVIEIGGVTPQGIRFVERGIEIIEERGLEEEGLYRKPGVLSKATRLVKDSVERGKLESLNLRDEFEWDTKTIASAVKGYFSKHLGEPLLTFDLHMQFVDAAKVTDTDKRVETLRNLVMQLPPDNRTLLHILMQHLNRVAGMSDRNLMKASNLGVVFGPTLMRPERETVATIVDIKYQNIIVEVMIEETETIFTNVPLTSQADGSNNTPLPISQSSSKPPPLPEKPPFRHAAALATPSSSTPPPILSRKPGNTSPEPPHENGPGKKSAAPPLPKKPTDSGQKRQGLFGGTTSDHKPSVFRTASKKMGSPTRGGWKTEGAEATKNGPDPPVPPARPSRKKTSPKHGERSARALYDCNAEDVLELSFQKDDILYDVRESDEPEWLLAARQDGKKGLVPANYVELLP
jgi:Rho GTPase-activating protein 10